ncbi:MAG: hypothetical protein Q8R98_11255 [Rubrivivax sp.]|nr:hypothetical protein [Rubrivivax sp.]
MFDSLPLLLAVGEGNHFLYYSFNATAIGTFGEGYFAPVAVNVVISVAVAWLATRLVVAEGLCVPRLAPAFFAFMTLHPDILAWSTVLNGKDTLVLLLHVLLLTAVSWFLKGWRWRALVLAATATAVLLFLRFYVPVLFAIALAVVGALGMSRTARWRMLGLSALVGSGLVWQMGGAGLQSVLDALRAEFVNPVWGLLRFTLTPIPFNTSPEYAFLDFPALLHWLFLPAAVLGFLTVLRTPTPFARYLAVYTLVFVALYAVYGELQGPRHRLQLDFAWATFQFIGIGVLVRLLATISVRRRSSGRADHFTQSPTP